MKRVSGTAMHRAEAARTVPCRTLCHTAGQSAGLHAPTTYELRVPVSQRRQRPPLPATSKGRALPMLPYPLKP